ncbi:hypothetical protein SADUNF_Sadunf06G0186400 [Salix dunnii]|uniref:Uncharacterized protein n=1 Tax=Salix dunnii TaxID=1413687 RepID=A0A835K810_9ROSI|nr:hypothetical protein SADUNF_Sadunf06G0186400 [Salix dunnii]
MGRAPCCDKANVKRGPWSPEEDATLKSYLETHGTGGNWISLPQKAAAQLPGRTDNDVKNYWNTKLKKKILVGKISLTIRNNSISAPASVTNIPAIPCSTSPILYIPKAETESTVTFSDHYSLTQGSGTLPNLSDVGYEPAINSATQNWSPNHFQYSSFPGVIDMSEFRASSMSSHIVSSSQEGSAISDSSSLAMDNNGLSLPSTHGGPEDVGILMDSELGFPSDFVNDFLFQDKASEMAANCFPYFADFGYVDIKPQGLNQGVTNQY